MSLFTETAKLNLCLTSKKTRGLRPRRNIHHREKYSVSGRSSLNFIRAGTGDVRTSEVFKATRDKRKLLITNSQPRHLLPGTARFTLYTSKIAGKSEYYNNHILNHVMANLFRKISSIAEANRVDVHHCKSSGKAEMRIPTPRISREISTGLENSNGKTRLTVPVQNAYVDTIARTVFTSNSSLQTDMSLFTSTAWGNKTTEEAVSQYLNHIFTDMEADEPDDNYSFNITSVYEPATGNVSAVAEGDDSATFPTPNTTSTTTLTTACSYPCHGQDQYGQSWTGCPGYYVNRPCPNGALGEAKWFCDSHGNSFIGDTPDYANCTHTWIEEVHEEVSYSCPFNASNVRAPRE
jgi:hypothetical protein